MTTPTPKEVQVEEAALAAKISAEHAAAAAQQADKDDLAARQAAKDDPRARLCPNCKAELIKHSDLNPFKAGCSHCNNCGACWAPGLKELRLGHPAPGAVAA